MSENIRRLAAAVSILFLLVSLGVGYWQVLAADALANDPYNPRGYVAAQTRQRGTITDRDGGILAESVLVGDVYRRRYASPVYEPFLGYATLRFGAAGLERTYARSLVGEDPADPLGAIRRRYLNEQTPPGSVRLAISARLQQIADRALGNRVGAVVAIEPRTGEILASVSNPRYDANPLVDPQQQQAAFERMRADPARPFLDRAAQGLYPPGSTFKVITGAAGIETGAIEPARRVRVDSPWQADPSWGNYSVRSVTNAHREFDLNQAFMFSENIYFAMAGVRMGGDRLADYAGRFMIGKDLQLDGEASRSQLSATGRLDRGPVLVADTSFGQGELLLSPLHMALIAATFANSGAMPMPRYALDVRDAAGNIVRRISGGTLAQPIRADTARRITEALVASVEGQGAFAFGARIPGVRVAGKTGSAENPSGAPHGWFIGFAPADQPTIAVAVLIEHTPRGGEEAAPIGGAVMRGWLGR